MYYLYSAKFIEIYDLKRFTNTKIQKSYIWKAKKSLSPVVFADFIAGRADILVSLDRKSYIRCSLRANRLLS